MIPKVLPKSLAECHAASAVTNAIEADLAGLNPYWVFGRAPVEARYNLRSSQTTISSIFGHGWPEGDRAVGGRVTFGFSLALVDGNNQGCLERPGDHPGDERDIDQSCDGGREDAHAELQDGGRDFVNAPGSSRFESTVGLFDSSLVRKFELKKLVLTVWGTSR
jgi:hypothetical protein